MSAPHGDIGLGGPGLWAIAIVMVFVALFAAAVPIDLLLRRGRAARFAAGLACAVPQVAYLAALAWLYIKDGAGWSARAVLITLPLAVVGQTAYVLFVVSPRRRAAADDASPQEPEDPALAVATSGDVPHETEEP